MDENKNKWGRLKFFKGKKIYVFLSLCLLLVGTLVFFNITKSIEVLENDTEVEPDTDLIYYLKINYDGKDRNSLTSGVDTNVQVFSSYIYVEDKIPYGLEFQEFTVDGNRVGAVNSTTNETCPGGIVDDTNEQSSTNNHGLHYDETTRTVHFKIKGMQAGCEMLVGIKTKTPSSVDDPATPDIIETRRDFYNTATAREDKLTATSNTVHAFMQSKNTETFKVTYEYSGTVPSNAPSLPPEAQYAENSKVVIASIPVIPGYRFTGWKVETESGTVIPATNAMFVMPKENVKLVGSFEIDEGHKVTYVINEKTPEGYTVPIEKEYFVNEIVSIDTTLKAGDIFNGYKFNGWTTTDVTVKDGEFTMGSTPVTITGTFEEVTYQVKYQFQGDILPPNSDSLLPPSANYTPGSTVNLASVDNVTGYKFLGWNKENNFLMPEENVTVYGEWTYFNGYFEPQIKKEITNGSSFKEGDTVKYKITVTNKENYPIKNVNIVENKERAKFVAGSNYTLRTDKMVEIASIAANSSVEVFAEYKVTSEDAGTITNEVELVGATADNYYELDESKEYKATASFTIKKSAPLTICQTVDKNSDTYINYHITNKDNTYDAWIYLNNNECKKVNLYTDEYRVLETVPQGFNLTSVTGLITSNGETFRLPESDENTITFNHKKNNNGFYKTSGRIENTVPKKKTLYDTIKEDSIIDNVASKHVTSETGINFGANSSNINGKGLYIRAGTENDEYPIMYYRGNIMNNNVLFANFCWKIVRTTELGGMKLIYNGSPDNNQCNNSGTATQIGISAFNSLYANQKYSGYMYSDNSDLAEHGNINSTIKIQVDKWFKTNLTNEEDNSTRDYRGYLEDAVWCNDRKTGKRSGASVYYETYNRLYYVKGIPLIKNKKVCTQTNDRYTVRDIEMGNGALMYPVSLLTADETILAGATENSRNISYYLYTAQNYWLLSPSAFVAGGVGVHVIRSDGQLIDANTHVKCGIRPSIVLKKDINPISGNGEPETPYVIE